MYGLKEKDIITIQTVLKKFPQITEVLIYGSRAKGNYKNGSDIDLTFKGKNLTLKDLNNVSLLLDELYLPYSFDLSIFDQIENPALIDHINRVGIVFYKSSYQDK